MWTQTEAIAFCKVLEAISPQYGCHVALTGGTLYRDGPRKDIDVVFYRIRHVDEINVDGLRAALEVVGVEFEDDFGWVLKGRHKGKKIDFLFPERPGDWDYEG